MVANTTPKHPKTVYVIPKSISDFIVVLLSHLSKIKAPCGGAQRLKEWCVRDGYLLGLEKCNIHLHQQVAISQGQL